MNLLFCLFKYFPHAGGLQKDFFNIAKLCEARGHQITILTASWQSEKPAAWTIVELPVSAFSNHMLCWHFAKRASSFIAQHRFDIVFGFNKMPNLDLYYCADVCLQHNLRQSRPILQYLLPRYRKYLALEKAVFAKEHATTILALAKQQIDYYQKEYATPSHRFHLLPPGINPALKAPDDAAQKHFSLRQQHRIPDDRFIFLMLGSNFRHKGLDRSIKALATLPYEEQAQCELWVIGKGKPKNYLRLRKKLKLASPVTFLGIQKEVAPFLQMADCLLHPAYHENTGTAILEAIVAGLPVITTGTCGYAEHVANAHSGFVIPEPFEQMNLNNALVTMLQHAGRHSLRENAIRYGRDHDLYSQHQAVVDFIETNYGRQAKSA